MVKQLNFKDIAPPIGINGNGFYIKFASVPDTIARCNTANFIINLVENTAPNILLGLYKWGDIQDVEINDVCFRAFRVRLISGDMYVLYKQHRKQGNKYIVCLRDLRGLHRNPVPWFWDDIPVYINEKIFDWYETDLGGLIYIIEFINDFYKLNNIYDATKHNKN